jgi:hypothetical protein
MNTPSNIKITFRSDAPKVTKDDEVIATLPAGTCIAPAPRGIGFIAIHPDHAAKLIRLDGTFEELRATGTGAYIVRDLALGVDATVKLEFGKLDDPYSWDKIREAALRHRHLR